MPPTKFMVSKKQPKKLIIKYKITAWKR